MGASFLHSQQAHHGSWDGHIGARRRYVGGVPLMCKHISKAGEVHSPVLARESRRGPLAICPVCSAFALRRVAGAVQAAHSDLMWAVADRRCQPGGRLGRLVPRPLCWPPEWRGRPSCTVYVFYCASARWCLATRARRTGSCVSCAAKHPQYFPSSPHRQGHRCNRLWALLGDCRVLEDVIRS